MRRVLFLAILLCQLVYGGLIAHYKFDDCNDNNVVWNDVLTEINLPGTKASLIVEFNTPGNKLVFTADQAGSAGNGIAIKYVTSPSYNFSVYIVDNNIIMRKKYNDSNNYTIAQLKTLIDANAAASALVDVSIIGDGNEPTSIFSERSLTGGTDPCVYTDYIHGYYKGLPKWLTAFVDVNEQLRFMNGDFNTMKNLYLATSQDGINWHIIDDINGVYTEPNENLGVGSIMRWTDGYWYYVYDMHDLADTNGWEWGRKIKIIKSPDLLNWQDVITVDFGEATMWAWAPEWYIENAEIHIFVSLRVSPGLFEREIHPLTSDFSSWSEPLQISQTPYSPRIDAFIRKYNGKYYKYHRNTYNNYIERGVADNLLGPYIITDTNNWAGWGQREGPYIVELPDGNLRMYCEATLGPVGYSDFNGTSWSAWRQCTDDSCRLQISHNSVIPYGSGTWTSYNSVSGKIGRALRFDGNSYVDTNTATANFATNNFTIAGWFRLDDGQKTMQYFCGVNDNTDAIILVVNSDGNVYAAYKVDSSTISATSPTPLPDGDTGWKFICMAVGQTDSNIISVKLYIDGQLVASGSGPGQMQLFGSNRGSERLVIGACNNNGDIVYNMTGAIDDVRIYNKVLSEDEVEGLYVGNVGWVDIATLARNWLSDCQAPEWCSGSDIDHSGRTDFFDFTIFASNWLADIEAE